MSNGWGVGLGWGLQLVKDAGGVNPAFSVDQMFNVSLPEQAAAFQKFLKVEGGGGRKGE